MRTFFLFTCVLGLVYNVSPLSAVSVTSGRLAMVLLALVYIGRFGVAISDLVSRFVVWLIALCIVLFYNAVLYAISGGADFTELSRVMHYMLFSFFGAIFLLRIFEDDLRKFLVYVTWAMVIYAALTLLNFFYLPFGDLIRSLFFESSNITEELASKFGVGRVSAFGFGGAKSSVLQSVGVLTALFLARVSRGPRVIVWVACALLCTVAILLNGRTGLMLAVVVWGLYGVYLLRTFSVRNMLLFLAVGVAGLFALRHFYAQMEEHQQGEYMQGWVARAFSTDVIVEETNYQQIVDGVPAITMQTIIGTGLVTDGVYNVSDNDCGYIQTYYAMGLPCSVVFYFVYFALVFVFGSMRNSWSWILFLVLLVLEIKEPFSSLYSFVMVVYCISCWTSRSRDLSLGSPATRPMQRGTLLS